MTASAWMPTPEPTLTPTPTEIPTPFIADWPYPRHDLANTAASTDSRWQLLQQPVELWQVTAPEGYTFGSFFPVAADLDNDDRVEYLIGVTNFDKGDCWLYAINIEDGTVLWKQQLDSVFYWSAPVIVNVNNDEQLDIVLATNSWHGPIQVMALNGNDASSIWTQSLPADGMGMTVADVNGDGWVEVVVNDYGDPKTVYLLNGQDGNVIWQRETGGSVYNIPTVGDIDGDGRPEIVQHNHLYQPARERLLVLDQDGNELWTYSASPSADQEANAPPELGWTPDYGYISTTLADFNADGEMEVGWGTRCHYYLLNGLGNLLWRVPTCEGHGVSVLHMADGTVRPDEHGTGGLTWFDYAAGVGNIDDDPALEIILPLGSEYREDRYASTGARSYSQVTPANMLWALDGEDGTVQWVFEGSYFSTDHVDSMYEPILVDLTADGLLDILALSSSGHLYAIHGTTGKQLIGYPVQIPGNNWYAVNLTFVGNRDKGIVLFNTVEHNNATQISTNILRAWQIAERASK